jgi:hypothetical protein
MHGDADREFTKLAKSTSMTGRNGTRLTRPSSATTGSTRA